MYFLSSPLLFTKRYLCYSVLKLSLDGLNACPPSLSPWSSDPLLQLNDLATKLSPKPIHSYLLEQGLNTTELVTCVSICHPQGWHLDLDLGNIDIDELNSCIRSFAEGIYG
jgi:hypothetical protein